MFTKEETFNIWKSKPSDFNQWRRGNDLKNLFDYIISHSESFVKWMEYYELEIDDLLSITPTRNVFYGDEEKFCTIYKVKGVVNYSMSEKPIAVSEEMSIVKGFGFVPYLKWKDIHDHQSAFVINSRGREFGINNFMSAGPQSQRAYKPDDVEIITSTMLFSELQLLKIGNCRLPSDFDLFSRNLDFLDLDNIELFDDSGFWYSGLDICCSTIRGLSLKNTNANVFKIKYCNCSKLTIKDSIVKGLEISYSNLTDQISGVLIERSKLEDLQFKYVSMSNISFYDSDFINFHYTPLMETTNEAPNDLRSTNDATLYDNVRRFRIAFSNMGNNLEASYYYYWERCLELKLFKFKYKKLPPTAKYAGPYLRIIKNFIKKNYKLKSVPLYFKWRTQYHYKCWFKREYRTIRTKMILYHLQSIIEKFIWGFGEKPLRIIRNGILLIGLYSIFYFFSSNAKLNLDFINSIYYSIITFTTLGYGDIVPGTDIEKIAAASEAFLGAISMGLLIAAYAKNSRS